MLCERGLYPLHNEQPLQKSPDHTDHQLRRGRGASGGTGDTGTQGFGINISTSWSLELVPRSPKLENRFPLRPSGHIWFDRDLIHGHSPYPDLAGTQRSHLPALSRFPTSKDTTRIPGWPLTQPLSFQDPLEGAITQGDFCEQRSLLSHIPILAE